MSLGPGTRLGPYEIAALIGEGGMGNVWRAHHIALNRHDALKVLPEAFASDPDRLARFRREAQVLASLNHPNIAHVYGLEQADGLQALVMEMVEGDTLAERIARGAIQVDEALSIAKQIAEALQAAHEQGTTLGSISKRGNTYLRELFIQGAQSSFVYLKRDQSSLGQWLRQVETRRQRQVAIVALANKMVRICWKVLTSEEDFRAYPARVA